ncbi:MAG TPA: hypothetical protein VF153_03765, partial [Candidatus Limnocylindria bacterium]
MSFLKVMSSLALGAVVVAASVVVSPPRVTALVGRRSTINTQPQAAAGFAVAGYGRNTVGGAGGRTVRVTNLH